MSGGRLPDRRWRLVSERSWSRPWAASVPTSPAEVLAPSAAASGEGSIRLDERSASAAVRAAPERAACRHWPEPRSSAGAALYLAGRLRDETIIRHRDLSSAYEGAAQHNTPARPDRASSGGGVTQALEILTPFPPWSAAGPRNRRGVSADQPASTLVPPVPVAPPVAGVPPVPVGPAPALKALSRRRRWQGCRRTSGACTAPGGATRSRVYRRFSDAPFARRCRSCRRWRGVPGALGAACEAPGAGSRLRRLRWARQPRRPSCLWRPRIRRGCRSGTSTPLPCRPSRPHTTPAVPNRREWRGGPAVASPDFSSVGAAPTEKGALPACGEAPLGTRTAVWTDRVHRCGGELACVPGVGGAEAAHSNRVRTMRRRIRGRGVGEAFDAPAKVIRLAVLLHAVRVGGECLLAGALRRVRKRHRADVRAVLELVLAKKIVADVRPHRVR